jgi:alpha-beta hydrolase superfamily lysophospholipase
VIDPRPDILPGCFAEDLPLALDPWGPAAATLVEYRGKVPNPGPGGRAILYLHGFNDYFHCSELGPRFAAAGYRFYALDCRGHGRAIRPGRPVSYVAHLSTYFEEIAAAITLLRRRDGCTWVALLGHSTGGLVAPLYVAARNGVDALLLNSPFFAFRAKPALQVVLHIGCPALSLVRPLAELPLEPDARYAWSIHESFGKGGKWDYDLGWKQPGTLPIRAAWVRAVVAGQLRVRRGLDLRCPVHVMASDRRGGDAPGFSRDWMKSDTVLDPDSCIDAAVGLGRHVTTSRVHEGMHDLVLSIPRVREDVYEQMIEFLDRV